MRRVVLINGPNLNKLGFRDNKIYGSLSYDSLIKDLKEYARNLEIELLCYQSNSEGEIIDKIQDISEYDGLIINPGAYSHYSYAIRDALEDLSIPKIEVHISNIYDRESFRQKSVTAAVMDGLIAGLGTDGYYIALYGLKLKF